MYISIVTLKGYENALNTLLESIPDDFKNIIIIYQNEPNEIIEINSKNYIIVKIKHNIYEYGAFIGLYRVFNSNLIDKDEIVLMLHDTCKLGEKSIELSKNMENVMRDELKADILFISSKGNHNICFVNKTAVDYGNNIYKDLYTLSKYLAIQWETNFYQYEESIKAFYVKRSFINTEPEYKGKDKIYGNVERHINYFKEIDLIKYYVQMSDDYHPNKP